MSGKSKALKLFKLLIASYLTILVIRHFRQKIAATARNQTLSNYEESQE